MPAALIGRKIGMSRYFMEDGRNVPVTVIQAGPCAITQIKTQDADGYAAVQISSEDIKPRRSTFAQIGHDAKAGTAPKRLRREIRMNDDKDAADFSLGQTLDVKMFENIAYVDVIGTSKGKGFQGVMKRHRFKGLCASHGTERKHRSAGSIGGHATNRGTGPKVKKGKLMAGQMGNARVTVRSLDVISIDAENNLILVKGPVPGPTRGVVFVREAVRLFKGKGTRAKSKKAG
jgi:large subunit ribosomal protein L3